MQNPMPAKTAPKSGLIKLFPHKTNADSQRGQNTAFIGLDGEVDVRLLIQTFSQLFIPVQSRLKWEALKMFSEIETSLLKEVNWHHLGAWAVICRAE